MKKKNLLMTAIAIFGLATITMAQVPSYVPTTGLVGYWPFNGNANDESGNGNNGTVNGATLTTDRFGNANSAYSFNGNTIDVNSGNQFAITQSSQFTVNFWYYTNSQASPVHFLGKRSTTVANLNWQFAYNIGSGQGLVFNGALGGCSTGSQITLGQWEMLTGVFNNGTWSIYRNGNFINSTSANVQSDLGNLLKIGNAGSADPFYGKLDDISIYNRALTQQEITALYNSQTCNTSSNTITADGITTFCAGNYVNLTSDVVGGTYQWKKNGVNITTNATSRTYKATATGSYTCAATCNGTALTSNAIAITSKTNAAVTLTATGATSFCAGDSVTLNATNLGSNYSIQWYRSNISIDNATGYTQVIKQPGTYKVVTKNLTTGCSRISGSAITTIVNCRIANSTDNNNNGTSDNLVTEKITGNDISEGISIYPNPNNGTFVLEYEGEQSGSGFMQVVNSMGQTIYESNVEVADGLFSKEVKLGDNISKGIYVVRLLINGSVNDSRIIVK